MTDYSKGKIYAIRSTSDPDLLYVGSTCMKYLCQRLGGHRQMYKAYKAGDKKYITSFALIERNDHYIELLENHPCSSAEELHKREGEIIRSLDCVNKQIAGRCKKQYYIDNKEKLLKKSKQYRENNKESLSQRAKIYRENNKEKIRQQDKQYREDNKEKIKEQRKQTYENNKEAISQKAKVYRERNHEKIRQQDNEYKQRNKDKISAQGKEYRERNKEALKHKKKDYYERNKDKITEKRRETTFCECGKHITICKLPRHKKSKQHQVWQNIYDFVYF